jgi:hypothetical protein
LGKTVRSTNFAMQSSTQCMPFCWLALRDAAQKKQLEHALHFCFRVMRILPTALMKWQCVELIQTFTSFVVPAHPFSLTKLKR